MWCFYLAYCTGLLLARRVLKSLEMDEDYEGNVEVINLFSVYLIYLFVDVCHCQSPHMLGGFFPRNIVFWMFVNGK